MFSGLSSLVIEDVNDRDGVIVVRARTAGGPVPCPRCAGLTGLVHGYYGRTVADVPADGRPVVVYVRVRRMRCPDLDCPVQTFREQVPGLLDRYQRRTVRLAGQAGEAVRRLAGRAGAGLLAALGIPLSRHTALRLLLRLPLPEVAVPRVLGVDDFALRRGQVYATILIDAETGQRVDVLASRKADVLETWLLSHPGVQVVCRDGSGAYGEAVRPALPGAVQAGDRWHLWHSLGEAVLKEVAAHSACWAAAGPPLNEGRQAQTTAGRWRQVHDLTDRGTGLLECSRRLGLSLNTVKRYARAAEPERMTRAPRYRATLVDPYREHLRARRAEDPAVPVHQLLAEIREQGYPGSMNLLCRYITQGRVEADRPHLSPRRVTRMLLTRPDALSDNQQAVLSKLTAACGAPSQCLASRVLPRAALPAAHRQATSLTQPVGHALSGGSSHPHFPLRTGVLQGILWLRRCRTGAQGRLLRGQTDRGSSRFDLWCPGPLESLAGVRRARVPDCFGCARRGHAGAPAYRGGGRDDGVRAGDFSSSIATLPSTHDVASEVWTSCAGLL